MRRIAALIAAVLLAMSIGAVFAQDEETSAPEGETAQEAAAQPQELLAADVVYVVEERDNLDGIGAFFDVRVGCIRETNNLSISDILYPGDELLISASCPAYDGADFVVNFRENAPGRDGSDGSYVVRPEDTLDQIGQTLNISVDALKQQNDITDGRTLEAGQIIIIPRDAPEYGVMPALDNSRAESAPEGSTIYVVQPQDTLDGIGAQLNKDHYCIIEANAITNTRLVIPGLALVIPDECGAYAGFDVVPANLIQQPETTIAAPETEDAEEEQPDEETTEQESQG